MRRTVFQDAHQFQDLHAFQTWWDDGESVKWKINARHRRPQGTVEYWRCAFMQVFVIKLMKILMTHCFRIVSTHVGLHFASLRQTMELCLFAIRWIILMSIDY